MRRLLAPIASLTLLLSTAGGAHAGLPKVPTVLKGSGSGETVIAAVPPYAPQSGRTTWSVDGLKLKLVEYHADFNGEFRAIYRLAAGTVSIAHAASGQCVYSFADSGKLRDRIDGAASDAIFGFSRAKGRSTIDTHIHIAGQPGVQTTCAYSSEPPIVATEEITLPGLFQIVPFKTKLKLRRHTKLHYKHQSTEQGSSLSIDWELDLKGSKFTNRPRS